MEENYWKFLKLHDRIFWTAVYKNERMQGLNDLKICIDNYGFIVDFHFFSDLAVSMEIAIEERKVNPLYMALAQLISLSKFKVPDSESAKERTVMLNVTFTKGTGNLKVEVLKVPG